MWEKISKNNIKLEKNFIRKKQFDPIGTIIICGIALSIIYLIVLVVIECIQYFELKIDISDHQKVSGLLQQESLRCINGVVYIDGYRTLAPLFQTDNSGNSKLFRCWKDSDGKYVIENPREIKNP